MRLRLAATLGLLALCLGCEQPPAPRPAEAPKRPTPVQRGAQLYALMCKVCHGASGEGYKADNAPQLANQSYLGTVPDTLLRAAIARGRSGTPMSAWLRDHGGPLTMGDVDALIAFLRSWQKGPSPVLDERPLHGDLERARPLYVRECARCHGTLGVTGPSVHIGDPDLLQQVNDGFLRHAIKQGRPGTPMEAFAGRLTDQDVDDLIALLRSFHARNTLPPPPRPATPPPIPLGPVPLHPKGPEPAGFKAHPGRTPVDVVAAQLKRKARLLLLDARAPSDYLREHIAGAVSVPFYDPTPYLAQLPKDAWLVSYCACPHAESQELAQKLVNAGFTKVTILDEGLGVWKAKKHETRTGDKP